MTYLYRLCILGIFALLSGCVNSTIVQYDDALARGNSLYNKGEYAAALLNWQSLKNSHDSALLLRQARSYHALGQTREALHSAEQALLHADKDRQTEVFIVLADIEIVLGLKQQAIEHLRQAHPQSLEDPNLATQLAITQGRMALLENQPEQALAQFATAQDLAKQLGDSVLQKEMAVTRWDLLYGLRSSSGRATGSIENPVFSSAELTSLKQTIDDVSALPESPGKDFLSVKLARLLLNLKTDTASASQLLTAATISSRQRGDQRLLSYALGYQGQLAEQQQRNEQALNLSAQAAFAAQQANAPESLYLWEWQAARVMQRQNRSDDAIAAYRRSFFNLQSIRPDLGSGTVFRERVAPLFSAFSDLLLKQARIETDRSKVESLLREVRDILEQQKAAELQDYFQDRCVANFKAKNKTLEEVTQNIAVIYPVLLPDRTEILVGFADGLRQYVIPIGNEQLTREVHEFRKKLEKRTTFQYLYSARELYQWLISPILADLRQHQIDTLIMVPDGALRSIPLAALNDGQHYLIEEFAVATTPGLALTDPQPLPQHLNILINGLTESVQDFPALPDVAEELDNIHQQFGGMVLKDSAFRLDELGEAMKKNPYRIIHIASHGQFDQDPSKTFLLTYDNKLTMDILERYISVGKYRDEPVELLTLSACKTAAGDDRAALGLAGVAVKAGARSALASLWFINDQASSQLVIGFYQQLQKHLSKAKALQQAQRDLLADPRFHHASYWAPFLMIGNWL
jgi:CHAT domain-containing protein